MWRASEREFAFAREDLNHSVLSGGVFSQFLSFREPEQDTSRSWGLQEGAADYSVWGKLRFIRQRKNFLTV